MRAIDLVRNVILIGRGDEAVELFPDPDSKKGVRYEVLYNVEDGQATFAQIRVNGKKYIVTVTEAADG